MSGKKENLEGFIKSRLEEKKYVYNERLWTPVGTVLLEGKKKSKRRWMALLSLLFILGLGSIFFIKNNKGDVKDEVAIISNKNKTDSPPTVLNNGINSPREKRSILKENKLKNKDQANLFFDKSKNPENDNTQTNKITSAPAKKTKRNTSFSKTKKAIREEEAVLLENDFSKKNKTSEASISTDKKEPVAFSENIEETALPKKGSEKNNPLIVQALPVAQFRLFENIPTINLLKTEPVKKADMHLPEGWQLFASVGTPSPRNSFGGNRVTVGLGYVHRFSRRWSVMATGGYRTYLGNKESVEFDKVTYGFVRKSEHYKLDVSKIHYANLYSSLGYHLAPRHVFLFGLGISKFITAHGELETRKERAQEFEAYSPVNSGTGYRKAFYPWNAELQLGYQYVISHRTTLGIGIQCPLKSILKTEYQNNGPNPLAYGHLFLTHQLRK